MRPYLRNLIFKCICILLCSILLSPKSFSQHIVLGNEKLKIEAGLNFGPTFFLGDIGGNAGRGTHFLKDLNLELTTLMKGAFVSVYPNDWLGFRIAGQYTHVSSRDNIISTSGEHETYRKERDLDFKTNMWEIYAAVELYPTMMLKKYDDYDPRLKPYVFIGGGLFHFNPKGSLTDVNGKTTWYDLQPLRTEGQGMAEYPDRKPYKLTQVNIPMGVGLKYDLSEKITVGTELLYRKTFTDYIDDLSTTYIDPFYFSQYLSPADAAIARKIFDKTSSQVPTNRTRPGEQRGNSKNMDAYFSTVIKLGIKLGSGITSENRRMMRQTKCPFLY
jgi:opacity protein-like surface antigen